MKSTQCLWPMGCISRCSSIYLCNKGFCNYYNTMAGFKLGIPGWHHKHFKPRRLSQNTITSPKSYIITLWTLEVMLWFWAKLYGKFGFNHSVCAQKLECCSPWHSWHNYVTYHLGGWSGLKISVQLSQWQTRAYESRAFLFLTFKGTR